MNKIKATNEIISFSINTECEELKKLINNTCNKEEKEKESVLYKGHILTSDKVLNFVFNNKKWKRSQLKESQELKMMI